MEADRGEHTLTFDGGYLHSVAGRRDERTQIAAPFSFLNLEHAPADAGHALGRWSHTVDADHSWSVQTYWDRNVRSADNLQSGARWDLWDVDFQHRLPLGERQQLVYGVRYRYTDTFSQSSGRDGGFAVSFQPPDQHLHLFSAFLQDELTLVPERFKLTLGSKFEHNDFTGFEVQPTVRLLWTPTPRQAVWAAAARAVRTPNLSEVTSGATVLPVFIAPGVPLFPQTRPNPALGSEEVWAYELGYRVQPRDNLSFDTALFYNVYDDLRLFAPGSVAPGSAPGTFVLPLPPANAASAETYGAELGANWQASESWQLHGAYTFLKMQLHGPAGAASAEGQSPQNQLYLRSSWNLPWNLEVDVIGRFVDQLTGFNPGGAGDKISAYLSLDARLCWHPRKNLALEVVGQNLLDDHHPELGGSAFIRPPLAEFRRGVYGQVTWRF